MPIRILCLPALVLLAAAAPAMGQPAATGVGRDLNPALSVNTLLLGRVADHATDRAVNGLDLQEAEVRLTSVVDPFWKANLVFAVHPEHDHGHDGDDEAAAHGGYAGDVEVATVDGQSLPAGFALRLGKDYLPFGKHVPLHTHQYPFVDAPVAVRTFLGAHGLTEVGARAAHGLPLPWYADLEAYAVDGRASVFDAASREPVWGARLVNMVDLGDDATLELSGSWLRGRQAPDYLQLHVDEPLAGTLDVWGVDATWKWISSAATKGPAATVTAEVVVPRPDAGAREPFGWYAVARCRFARDWWLGAGAGGMKRDLAEHDDAPAVDDGHGGLWRWEEVAEYKANLTWTPSEFSAVRLEAAHYRDLAGDADDTLLSLQVNFTIGSHPAHRY